MPRRSSRPNGPISRLFGISGDIADLRPVGGSETAQVVFGRSGQNARDFREGAARSGYAGQSEFSGSRAETVVVTELTLRLLESCEFFLDPIQEISLFGLRYLIGRPILFQPCIVICFPASDYRPAQIPQPVADRQAVQTNNNGLHSQSNSRNASRLRLDVTPVRVRHARVQENTRGNADVIDRRSAGGEVEAIIISRTIVELVRTVMIDLLICDLRHRLIVFLQHKWPWLF